MEHAYELTYHERPFTTGRGSHYGYAATLAEAEAKARQRLAEAFSGAVDAFRLMPDGSRTWEAAWVRLYNGKVAPCGA